VSSVAEFGAEIHQLNLVPFKHSLDVSSEYPWQLTTVTLIDNK